jgi:hypothetical protein
MSHVIAFQVEPSRRPAMKTSFVPEVVVCVPRVVFAQYWPLPWAAVLEAAERGVDGLTIQRAVNHQPDVAFLREGDGSYDGAERKGTTFLFQQNW